MSETFKRSWLRGWTRSSDGYQVRIVGRNNLEYRDRSRKLRIFVEPMSNWNDIVVDTSTIPDSADLPRKVIIERLRRAFAANGWNLLGDQAHDG